MEWKTRRVDDVVILDLDGRLTLGSDSLQEAVLAILDGGDHKILLNMAEVQYMDSTSVGELIVGYTSATSSGGDLKLLDLPPRIHELLRIHHLIKVFEVFEDEEAAVASFAAAPEVSG